MDSKSITVKPSAVVNKKSNSFVKGAAILGACGFIGKFLGAVYRIPLVYIVGAEGMGLYQMIFPMYALLLTISSSGIPTALSALIAERTAKGDKEGAGRLFGSSLITLSFLGIVCGALIALFAGSIARAQGNEMATLAYYGIAPSLIFVAVISAVRGYFQGRQNMAPSGISQIIEQIVKMSAGLWLAYMFLPRGLEYAVFGAALGVTISEFAAMAVLLLQFIFSKNKLPLNGFLANFWKSTKSLYALSIPVTLGGIILPLTQLIDSSLVINLLVKTGNNVKDATALFGLSSGPVNSLINMPVVLSLAVATAIVPSIAASKAHSDETAVKRKISLAMQITMLIVLPCAIFMTLFSREIIDFLYGGGLQTGAIDEPLIASRLLALSGVSVILVGFIQVSTSMMYSLGHSMLPVKNLAIGAAFKIILNLILLPRIGIYGVAFATVGCYTVTLILNIFSLRRVQRHGADFKKLLFLPLLACVFMAVGGYGIHMLLVRLLHDKIAFLITAFLSAALYACCLALTGAIDDGLLAGIPFFNRRKRSEKKP